MDRKTFRSKVTDEAWQFKIRQEKEKEWLESGRPKFWENIDLSLKNSRVKEVSRKTAEKIILEYEWLGDMAVTNQFYGIFFENWCGGVICINTNGVSTKGEHKFGVKKGELSYFARGACPFWTPSGTASRLLSYALKLEKKRGAKVAQAFADSDAGEYGTVYQATNWLYIGQNTEKNRQFVKGSRVLDTRTLCARAKTYNMKVKEYENFLIDHGWKLQLANHKHRYAFILSDGKEKEKIMNKIRHLVGPYPKRPA